jgi:uncharacterized protein YjbJ (UPF0337 family)
MSGTGDKLKGKLKKVEGEITGDEARRVQGAVEEKKGEVEQKIERAGERLNQKIDEFQRDRDSEKP